MKTNIFYLILIILGAYFPLNAQTRYDILINEFMANPKGAKGLPEVEYIELYNTTNNPISLKNWTIVNGNHKDTIKGGIIKANGYVTIHSRIDTNKINFKQYGDTLVINKMATLSNAGDEFILKNDSNQVIDAVKYDISTYQNTTKAKGGWSLERINPKNPCLLNNWIASKDGTKSGTPCQKNSVYDTTYTVNTEIISYYFEKDTVLTLKFNNSVSNTISPKINFTINNNITFKEIYKIGEHYNDAITLYTTQKFQTDLSYKLNILKSIKNCKSSSLLINDTTISIQYPSLIKKDSMLIINEILINPESGNFRYIEFYNRSKTKAYDLGDITIIDSIKKETLSISNHHIIFPNTYAVITENPNIVAKRYGVDSLKYRFLKHKLIAWSDNEGDIRIKVGSTTIDSIKYDKTFHSPLLANTEGVALERINPNSRKNDKSNWQSAAKTMGYGTPAYKNSQFNDKATPSVFNDENVSFHLEKTAFSSNEDTQDYLPILYKVDKSGYIANISIYNANGHFVTHLEQNTTIALEGEFRWYGETKRREKREESVKVSAGLYIIYVELLSLEGRKNTWKLLAYVSNN